jgi:hypothetical protein
MLDLIKHGNTPQALRLHYEWIRTGVLTLRQSLEFIDRAFGVCGENDESSDVR